MKHLAAALWVTIVLFSGPVRPGPGDAGHVKENRTQVDTWNEFADALYALHRQRLAEYPVVTRETTGGYGGVLNDPEFYREVRYIDARTDRLLSLIQWEQRRPDTIHSMATYFYDAQGRVVRSYLVSYLTDFRNAPIQALVNLHDYNDGLEAFRQFDASGNHLYDHCRGQYAGEAVHIALEEGDFLPRYRDSAVFGSAAYRACFEDLPEQAGRYLDPLAVPRDPSGKQPVAAHAPSVDEVTASIAAYTRQLEADPGQLHLYMARGRAYHQLHSYDEAIEDFSAVLAENDALDEAYFWRGMVLGRAGRTAEAIDDLSIYLQRHPEDSVAYTKRGVRFIWHGDLASAESDLRKAISLDAGNAEAFDDLGVILAQRGDYEEALTLFRTVVQLDPSYQKGLHNLALVLYILGRHEPALDAANASLGLSPTNPGSLALKGNILAALGRAEEAAAAFEAADFAPDIKDWTETFPIR